VRRRPGLLPAVHAGAVRRPTHGAYRRDVGRRSDPAAGRTGIIDPKFAQCVRAQTYRGWIAHETQLASAHPVAGAPNVLVNGEPVTAYGQTPTAGELTTAVTTAVAAEAAKSRK